MFARAFFVSALVAVAAAAPEAPKPQECADVPVVTVPDVTVVANSKICSPLPAGVCGSGVMVANVTYELPCAFGCPTTTTIWCEGNAIVDEEKKTCASKYWFCCGKDCKGVPAPRTCTYENKDYTVGVAYDLGNGKTMWCVDEETAVTCTGKECGSTLDLTPPRVETCPVPVKPLPLPQPECYRHKDCPNVNGVAQECNKGKCVPAQGPFPDDEFSYCRNDLECPKGHACKNGKCVPVHVPKPECRRHHDCPKVNGVAHECNNGKCVPAEGPFPDEDFSVCSSNSDCPAVNGLALECNNGQCVPAQGTGGCLINSDCLPVNGLAHVCSNGECVPDDKFAN